MIRWRLRRRRPPATRSGSTSIRHAGPDVLARIAPLVAALRARTALHEPRPGVFELAGRPFLHFHDDPAGIFADVRLAGRFVRMPVTSGGEQAELLDRIDGCLSAADARDAGRRRRDARRGPRPGGRRGSSRTPRAASD